MQKKVKSPQTAPTLGSQCLPVRKKESNPLLTAAVEPVGKHLHHHISDFFCLILWSFVLSIGVLIMHIVSLLYLGPTHNKETKRDLEERAVEEGREVVPMGQEEVKEQDVGTTKKRDQREIAGDVRFEKVVLPTVELHEDVVIENLHSSEKSYTKWFELALAYGEDEHPTVPIPNERIAKACTKEVTKVVEEA